MRRLRPTFASLALLVCACSPRAAEDPGKNSAIDRKPTAALGEAPPPLTNGPESPSLLDPSFALMQEICAGPCAGGSARVTVFREADGRVGRLRYDGDPHTCDHAPRIYLDAAGKPTLTVPDRPVDRETAKAIAATQAAEVEGLRKAETLACFDAERCDPERSEGFRSSLACRSDSDCVACQCEPVNRATWRERGGPDACNVVDEECIATNPACCDGLCVLAR